MRCLNGNVPHRLRPLYMCSPVGGAVRGGYETIQRWSIWSTLLWAGFELYSLLLLWFMYIDKNVMSLFTSPAAILCHVRHDGLYLSGTMSENKQLFSQVLFNHCGLSQPRYTAPWFLMQLVSIIFSDFYNSNQYSDEVNDTGARNHGEMITPLSTLQPCRTSETLW